jgi:hypothetical protein
MGTNYAPLLSNVFYTPMNLILYKNLSKTKKSREAWAFNLTPRYIDDVLPINNANFANWNPLKEISR